jgi:hypothetical protein
VGDVDLLLITHRKAQEVDGIIDAVCERGFSVKRINLCQYPELETYSWSLNTLESQIPRARAGWFHNPGRFTITRSLEGHGRELALNDCDAFWEGMALAKDCEWLNSPSALLLSSLKLSQLSAAAKLGVPVPDTLVTNDPLKAENFFTYHHGAVAKSLANGYSIYGEEQLKLYSRYYPKFPAELKIGLQYSPMIFQRRVKTRCELRVTYIDGKCFGLSADTTDLDGELIDIRRLDYKKEKGRFSGIDVPETICVATEKLMRHFNLSYAGLDWLQDLDGNWQFLELNCMGAFKWSELQGAGNITSALVEALVKRVENGERTI